MKFIWVLIGCGMVLFLLYLSLAKIDIPPVETGFLAPDKLFHFIAYFGLMTWFSQLATPSNRWLIGLNLFSLSVVIEVIQPYTGRNGDVYDLIANGSGIVFAWILSFKTDLFYRLWFQKPDQH